MFLFYHYLPHANTDLVRNLRNPAPAPAPKLFGVSPKTIHFTKTNLLSKQFADDKSGWIPMWSDKPIPSAMDNMQTPLSAHHPEILPFYVSIVSAMNYLGLTAPTKHITSATKQEPPTCKTVHRRCHDTMSSRCPTPMTFQCHTPRQTPSQI